MKTISIRQPWAEAMFNGKTVEVRSRFPVGQQPRIGEQVFIHAGKEFWQSDDAADRAALLEWDGSPWNLRGWWRNPELTPRGVLLGTAVFSGVARYRSKDEFAADVEEHWNNPDWFDDYRNEGGCCVGLIFQRAKKLQRPITFKGALGFFEVPLTFGAAMVGA